MPNDEEHEAPDHIGHNVVSDHLLGEGFITWEAEPGMEHTQVLSGDGLYSHLLII